MNTTKQIQIMVGLVLLLVVGLIAYSIWEPERQEDAEATQLEDQVERGAELFASNCTTCHGLEGEGFVGPALNVPANRPEDPAELQRLQDRFTNTIRCGRVGTFMPAWAQDQGGSLNNTQIEQLVLLITVGGEIDGQSEWEFVREHAEELNVEVTQPTPDQLNQGACGQVLRETPTPEPEGPVEVRTEWDISMGDNFFEPNRIGVPVGQQVTVNLTNDGQAIHNMRIAGPDGEYDTDDDVVSDPDTVRPGEEATLTFTANEDGTIDFRCDFHPTEMTGTIVVGEEAQAAGGAAPTPSAQAEAEWDVTMADNSFDPDEIVVPAGQEFTIALTNEGQAVHNMRIAGADGEYDTDDDIVSEPDTIRPGEDGELMGSIAQAGTMEFRCDFHPVEMIGTLTIQ
ncbi:MAG TPA: cupredoxin domain-containing protein [Dehalococcoidia bacterium]|nr:cupredoxin domain-containing protein [Dehalococcoidia bacterium]